MHMIWLGFQSSERICSAHAREDPARRREVGSRGIGFRISFLVLSLYTPLMEAQNTDAASHPSQTKQKSITTLTSILLYGVCLIPVPEIRATGPLAPLRVRKSSETHPYHVYYNEMYVHIEAAKEQRVDTEN